MSELTSLSLFFLAIAKVAVLCGFAPGFITILIYRKFSGRIVSREENRASEPTTATVPPRNVLARVA